MVAAPAGVDDPQTEALQRSRSIRAASLALALLLIGGGLLINLYIERERQRDLQQWSARLGLIAETRARSVERWIDTQFVELNELAENASLQLYLWQLTLARERGETATATAEVAYLRNLILATAFRAGYVADDLPAIPANLTLAQTTGLALLDTELAAVVGTPDMRTLSERFSAVAQRALETNESITGDIQLDGDDNALIAFAVPVNAVLGATGASAPRPLGVIVGVRNAAAELFPLLADGASLAEANEALLLTKSGNRVIYLSPTADGGTPTRRAMSTIGTELAEAQAVISPDNFAQGMNYVGEPVLQVSRSIANQPWVIAQQVNAREALSEANARRKFLISTLSLLLIATGAIAIAAWRHGSGVRAQHEAAKLADQAASLHRQTELLHAITDNMDIMALMLDEHDEVLFQNRSMAAAVGAEVAEYGGQSLNATVGPAFAELLSPGIEKTRRDNASDSQILQLRFGQLDGIYQVTFIPVATVGAHRNLTLIDFHDITAMQRAQRQQTGSLRTLVSTLVQLLDRHDPHSANHSARVTEVARAVARVLELSDTERRALELAATLCNIGKVMLPQTLLTKTGELTDDERAELAGHVDRGAEMLQNLNLDPAVLQTLRQKQELLDGSGYPRGLKAAQMTMMGRVLSAANAFVAMVSPRAYRDALPIRDAIDQLMAADDRFDRSVTTALATAAEQQPHWRKWRG